MRKLLLVLLGVASFGLVFWHEVRRSRRARVEQPGHPHPYSRGWE